MARFKLLAGQHIQADPDAKPLTAEQIKAGAKLPSHTYKKGEVISSDEDLVAKHGTERFERVGGGDAEPRASQVSVAPSGQVSSGFQSATGPATGVPEGQKAAVPEGRNAGRPDQRK